MRQLFLLVGLEYLMVGRRQYCHYFLDVVDVCWHRLFKMLLFNYEMVLLKSALAMCRSLTGWSTQRCFWLPSYSGLGLCQAVSSRLLVKMLLVFSPLPDWKHADLHPAIRWSKYTLLFYCLGNCTERNMQSLFKWELVKNLVTLESEKFWPVKRGRPCEGL